MNKTLALLMALLASAILFSMAYLAPTNAETASPAKESGAPSEKIIPVKEEEPSDYDKAVELYNKGKYRQAIALLEEYVKKRPKPEAYYLIGYAYYKLGKHDEANKFFKYSFIIDPLYSPTPGLEAKFKEPLTTARPERGGVGEPATTRRVMPKLIEDRPSSDVRAPEAEDADIPPAFIEDLKRAREAKAPPEVSAPVAEAEQAPAPPEAQVAEPGSVPAPVAGPVLPPPAPQVEAKAQPQSSAPEAPAPEAKPASPAEEPKPEALPAPPVPPRPEARPVPAPGTARPPVPLPPAYSPEEALNRYGPVVVIAVLAISAVLYLFFSLCIFLIARRLRVVRAWLAWVPIAQIWPIVGAAGKPWWWTLVLIVASLIPLVNILVVFAYVYLWMLITENLGKNKWLGLLVIPVGFLFIPYLAFSKAGKAGPSRKTAPVAESTEPALPDLGFDLEEEGLGPSAGGPGAPADKDDFVVEPWPEESEGSK